MVSQTAAALFSITTYHCSLLTRTSLEYHSTTTTSTYLLVFCRWRLLLSRRGLELCRSCSAHSSCRSSRPCSHSRISPRRSFRPQSNADSARPGKTGRHRKDTCRVWRLKFFGEDLLSLLLSVNVYLLFEGLQNLHVELQFLAQLFKSPRPVLVLPVSVLNGLTQHLGSRHIAINKPSIYNFLAGIRKHKNKPWVLPASPRRLVWAGPPPPHTASSRFPPAAVSDGYCPVTKVPTRSRYLLKSLSRCFDYVPESRISQLNVTRAGGALTSSLTNFS